MASQKMLEVFAGIMSWFATVGATGAYGTEVHTVSNEDDENKIENTINPHHQSDALSFEEAEELLNDTPTLSGGNNTKPVIKFDKKQISNYKDLNNLFEISSQIIFAELVLEENVRLKSYADDGKFPGINTIGGGSMWRPVDIKKNWKNQDATWFSINQNPKLASQAIDYEDMWLLQKGWGLYRLKSQGRGGDEGTAIKTVKKTVLERMYEKLKGVSLRPNEFAALFCAVYNNESRLNDLCEFVALHYADPIACAKAITKYSGVKERGNFESLVYLNANDFVKDMFNMRVCLDRRWSCIYVKGIDIRALTKSNYKELSDKYKKKYLKETYSGHKSLSPREAMDENVLKHFTYVLSGYETWGKDFWAEYDKAQKLYNKKEYSKALTEYKKLKEQHKEEYFAMLMNDIALTYQKLGKHQECIDCAKEILKTVDHDEYAKACYNAGVSYMALGNYQKAFDNFTWAEKHYNNYGISNADPDVDYVNIYKAKQKEAQAAMQKANLQSNNLNR